MFGHDKLKEQKATVDSVNITGGIGYLAKSMRPANLTLDRVSNGFVISCDGQVFVAKTYGEVMDKMQALLGK